MEPRIIRLAATRHSDVYLDEETIPETISRVLRNDGAAHAITGLDVDIRTTGTGYRKRSFVYRHEESCLAFISRHLEHEGMYYYFRQDKDREVMVIDDRISHEPATRSVFYRRTRSDGALDDTIHSFFMHETRLPAKVILKENNFRKSTLDLTATHPASDKGTGEITLYGENYRTPEEGKRYARIRAEELACRGRIFSTGSAVGITSGAMLNIEGHDRQAFNGEYLVVSVNHSGSQAEAALMIQEGKNDPYTVTFTCIPASVQYHPERITPVPVISGSLTAVIAGDGSGSYAELDDHGRDKVSLPFKEKKKDARNWAWMRMATPYAGSEEGMHFPLRKGTEVLLTFINGHPDNPVIAAAVPNSEQRSVVTSRNATTHALQTSTANGLFMTASGATMLREAPSGQNTGQKTSPQDEAFDWTKYVTGNEFNFVQGSSVSLYPTSKLTANTGLNVNWNVLGLNANCNCGPTLTANMFPTVNFQVGDSYTEGPGRVYMANKTINAIGLEGITLMAGRPFKWRTYKNAQWNRMAFSLIGITATVAGAAGSVINHFAPSESKYLPWIAPLSSWTIDAAGLIYYALAGKKDWFNIASMDSYNGRLEAADNQGVGGIVSLTNVGVDIIGARAAVDGMGALPTDTRPYIKVANNTIALNSRDYLLNNERVRTKIYMADSTVNIEASSGAKAAQIQVSARSATGGHASLVCDNFRLSVKRDGIRLWRHAPERHRSYEAADISGLAIFDNGIEAKSGVVDLYSRQYMRLRSDGGRVKLDQQRIDIESGQIIMNGKTLDLTGDYVRLGD